MSRKINKTIIIYIKHKETKKGKNRISDDILIRNIERNFWFGSDPVLNFFMDFISVYL